MAHFETVAKMVIGGEVYEPTTQVTHSHYGIPEWPGVPGPLESGSEVGIVCAGDDLEYLRPDRDTYDGEVIWSDEHWAVLEVDDYDSRYTAVNLHSGHAYNVDFPYMPGIGEEWNPQIRAMCENRTIKVLGAIPDWNGETIGLEFAF